MEEEVSLEEDTAIDTNKNVTKLNAARFYYDKVTVLAGINKFIYAIIMATYILYMHCPY